MIIRTRRKKEGLFRRIFGFPSRQLPGSSQFLDSEQFQRELLKEIYRSDRRHADREFGLIQMVFQDRDELNEHVPESDLLTMFRQRLRMADSFGWYDSDLAFLLPETGKEGTLQVANALATVALEQNIKVDTEVSVYPWDDQLVALSDELKTIGIRRNDDDDDDSHAPESSNGSLSNGEFRRSSDSNNGEPGSDDIIKCNGLVTEVGHAFVKPALTPWWKRTIDIVGSGTGLILLSPVFLLAAVAIKLNSKGPIFFSQQREGKDAKPFGILKFRTMVADAEAQQADLRGRSEQDGPAFKLENDPRVTSVGRYLRKSCVDELPQLVNVLLGQMSLVGPRPLPMHESYACTAWQRARLTVLPGLTCTWQAHGGRDVKFNEWMRMDLEYIQKQSFWFDLKLIFETALIALMHRGSV